jgi:hypothetical protein
VKSQRKVLLNVIIFIPPRQIGPVGKLSQSSGQFAPYNAQNCPVRSAQLGKVRPAQSRKKSPFDVYK